jgi:hypothetical protein
MQYWINDHGIEPTSFPSFYVGGMRSPDLHSHGIHCLHIHYTMSSRELAAIFDRDLIRLTQELRAFPDTSTVWQTAPGVANAAGTLALHLEGNLREFVGRLLGQIAFERNRPLEFSARGVERDEIVSRVDAVREMVSRVIASLPDEVLSASYPEPYDGASVSTHQFLVHLLAHLNYHLGQIDYLRRFTTGQSAITLASLTHR